MLVKAESNIFFISFHFIFKTCGRHGFLDCIIFRDVIACNGFSQFFVHHGFSSHCDKFLTEFVAHFSGFFCHHIRLFIFLLLL